MKTTTFIPALNTAVGRNASIYSILDMHDPSWDDHFDPEAPVDYPRSVPSKRYHGQPRMQLEIPRQTAIKSGAPIGHDKIPTRMAVKSSTLVSKPVNTGFKTGVRRRDWQTHGNKHSRRPRAGASSTTSSAFMATPSVMTATTSSAGTPGGLCSSGCCCI